MDTLTERLQHLKKIWMLCVHVTAYPLRYVVGSNILSIMSHKFHVMTVANCLIDL